MIRNRRRHITDLFYNTGDMNEKTVDESFGISREFRDTVSQEMLEDERLKKKHDLEAQNQPPIYPSCDLKDRPF